MFLFRRTLPVLTLMATLAGCGGDDGSSTTTTDTATAADAGSTADAAADTAAPGDATATGTDTGTATDVPAGPKDLVDTAAAAGKFKTLLELATAADLAGVLKSAGPFTVFAPTDEAFAKLDKALVDKLKADKAMLQMVLKHHVLSGKILAKDVQSGFPKTVAGLSLPVQVAGGKVTVGGATVVTADVEASNGVIHVIDAVILPPTLASLAMASPDHTKLVELVAKANLLDAVTGPGPLTVFAPTNAAFAALDKATLDAVLADNALLAAVLKHHVLPAAVLAKDVKSGFVNSLAGFALPIDVTSTGVFVGGAKVVVTDLVATNGVIHVIDKVIVPPDVVGVAMASPMHTTLVDLVKAAGLVTALTDKGPFTVFAPTNEAFGKLDKALVDSLLMDTKALGDVLKYHVVSGKVMAADVKDGEVASLLGAKLTLKKDANGVTINGAKVVLPDLGATNGVVHVIDSVLLPPK